MILCMQNHAGWHEAYVLFNWGFHDIRQYYVILSYNWNLRRILVQYTVLGVRLGG